MLGDLTFMSAKSFLIKSTSEIASYSSHSRFDQSDPSQTRPFRIPQRANRNILPFLSFYSLSSSRSSRVKQLHPRRSVHWLQRVNITELFLPPSLIVPDVPYLNSITSHNALYFSSLITAILINCSRQFQSICRSFNPLGVAVIERNVDFLIDPFNEIHTEHFQTYVPKSDAGDYWFGEVDESQCPNGAGRLVTQNQVVKTFMCNNAFNGWTEIYQTDDFQELFDGENEKGVFINGKRFGTFVKKALNDTLSYRSYLNDKPFPEDFVRQYKDSDWVITNDMIRCCSPLLRKEICPLFFDCATKITLTQDVNFPREFVLLQGLVKTLVFDKCESSNVVNVVLSNLADLKKIEFKNGAFARENARGALWVMHCPQLSSIYICDDGSCAHFSGFFLTGLL